MFDRHYDFDLASLAARAVGETRALVLVIGADGYKAAALDPDKDEFVFPPALNSAGRHVLALSSDGRAVALIERRSTSWDPEVCVVDLGTGAERWLAAVPAGQVWLGAFSPDGTSLATLCSAYDAGLADDDPDSGYLSVLSVLDLASGRHRQLWARAGGWSAESGVAWSPSGKRIAATYLRDPRPDEDAVPATLVMDSAGAQLAYLDSTFVVPRNNGAWIDEDRILCFPELDDEWHQVIVDVRDGTLTDAGKISPNPFAKVGTRYLFPGQRTVDDPIRVVAANLDGTRPRPFLTMRGRYAFETCLLADQSS